MTREDLQRCELELEPLVPLPGVPASAEENARAFNANASDVRAALLEPIRGLLEKGGVIADLTACLEKAVAELAFWRRVLLKVHPGAFGTPAAPSEWLLRYLRS
jgi:hypothetical protein